MKPLIVILGFLLFLPGFVSCDKQEYDPQGGGINDGRVAVKFASGLEGNVRPRVSGDQWTAGDKVGIFMVWNGQPLSDAAIAEGANNREYTADASGNLSPFNPSQEIYYPTGEREVDFIAYYPWSSAITNYTYHMRLAVQQTNLSSLDFIYANNATGLNEDDANVQLQFRHMMAQVVLKMVPGPGVNTISDINGILYGFYSETDFSLVNGTFSNPVAGNIIIGSDQATLTTTLFLAPMGAASGRYLTYLVTLNGNYSAPTLRFPDTATFESGKRYNYTVEVHIPATKSTGAKEPVFDLKLDSVEDMNEK